MTISRVNSDWSFGAKLTSDELDAIEDNITYALDKRAGQTDTLASDVEVTGETVFLGDTYLHGYTALAGHTEIGGDTDIIDGATVSVETGCTIAASGGLIKTAGGGRFELGDNDYPQLAPGHIGRTVVRRIPPSNVLAQASALSSNGSSLGTNLSVPDNDGHLLRNISYTRFLTVDTSTNFLSRAIYFDLGPYLVDGATLTEVSVSITGASGHGAMPALKPRIRVVRQDLTGLDVVLHSAGDVIADATTLVSNYQSPHNIVATCDQNNAISKSASLFHLVVLNEGGTSALGGLLVRGITITQTIEDLRPG